jgi:hypothetical protein
LGAKGQVSLLDRSAKYIPASLGDNTIIVPMHILGTRSPANIPEEELDLYQTETEEQGITWVGPIDGISPVSEMLQKAGFQEASIHPVEMDQDRTNKSVVNNDPHSEVDTEVFFRVPEKTCQHWNCPIHRPVEHFVYALANMKPKKLSNWFYVGRALEDPKSVQADKLLWAKDMVNYTAAITEMLSMPSESDMLIQLHKAQKEEEDKEAD